jgi:hypothetical protein
LIEALRKSQRNRVDVNPGGGKTLTAEPVNSSIAQINRGVQWMVTGGVHDPDLARKAERP